MSNSKKNEKKPISFGKIVSEGKYDKSGPLNSNQSSQSANSKEEKENATEGDMPKENCNPQ